VAIVRLEEKWMITRQVFTTAGRWGVVLWVAGPPVAGIGHWISIDQVARAEGYSEPSLFLIGAAALATLIAVPLMLIGREFTQSDY
jgi:hypothetical protein